MLLSQVDIFSFGVVLWELVMKTSPVRGQLSDLSSCGRCPASIAALFQDCIATDAADRPTAAEVFQRLTTDT
jgi:serine/threonine protein kinase